MVCKLNIVNLRFDVTPMVPVTVEVPSSFPISVGFIFLVSNSLFGFTVATSQKFQDTKLSLLNGRLADNTAVTNAAQAF